MNTIILISYAMPEFNTVMYDFRQNEQGIDGAYRNIANDCLLKKVFALESLKLEECRVYSREGIEYPVNSECIDYSDNDTAPIQ